MLTRLRVKGFKNLVDTEVHFGPFTCIAGANAVGKSNLFDAIRFLSLLANGKLDEAGRAIRAEGVKNADVRSLFTAYQDEPGVMEFDLDMIVPPLALDDLHQEANASATYLNYRLTIGYRSDPDERRRNGELQLISEHLTYVKQSDARKRLGFACATDWIDSVVTGNKRSQFISTADNKVTLHQDGTSSKARGMKKRGTGYKRLASQLPRTVVSAVDADSPTVLCAQTEMRSWEMVQLEPSAMRESDPLHQPPGISAAGAHMPATLFDLGRTPLVPGSKPDPEAAYQRVGNRLAELLGDAGSVVVDEDAKRELLTLCLRDKFGALTPARSLSDGTLSFIALILKQMEPASQRLLCMEEPENGIHPKRIAAILRLLREIAADTTQVSDDANPLRQVIINTHSPAVVQQVPADSLLVAEALPWNGHVTRFSVSALEGTWRQKHFPKTYRATNRGALLAYLKPAPVKRIEPDPESERVIDRKDIQMILDL